MSCASNTALPAIFCCRGAKRCAPPAKADASQVAEKIDGKNFTVLRQASEAGQLFGSVSPRDLVTLIGASGFQVTRNQIALNTPIKTIGQHKVSLSLHPEIET